MTLTREDTGSFAPVREVGDDYDGTVGPALTGWTPSRCARGDCAPCISRVCECACHRPLHHDVYQPQEEAYRDYTHADGVIRAAAKAERDQAALLAAWIDEHASWAAAEMRQIVQPLAAEQAAQHAATTYAQLPPNPAGQLAPEALDAEHRQRQDADPWPVIHVDFNAQARGGQIKASVKQASRPIEVGQTVRAVDPHEEDMSTPAVVRSIEGACAYLEPLLDPSAPEPYDGWPPANSHDGLARRAEERARRPAQQQPGPPEPRRLLRGDLAAWWQAVPRWAYRAARRVTGWRADDDMEEVRHA